MFTDPQTRWVRARDLSQAPVDDEIVILNLPRDNYIALDPIGKRIWELLEAPLSAAELSHRLTLEYDVGEAQCQEDVQSFLEQLQAEGLIHAVDSPDR
jgi:Coenzyme PQQ synthesis protein D (PqqD)